MSNTVNGALLKQFLMFIKNSKAFENVVMDKVKLITVSNGVCKAKYTVQPEHVNCYGSLHGGYSASLCDIISGIALLSHKREGGGVSVNLNLSYFKGAAVGDEVEIEAITKKAGQNLGFLDVEIRNSQGEILVQGSHIKYIGGTYMNK